MEKQRVDIELDKETLKWAGIEAAKSGISRRKYLTLIIEREQVISEGYAALPQLYNKKDE